MCVVTVVGGIGLFPLTVRGDLPAILGIGLVVWIVARLFAGEFH
jgi:hypothetical protein